MKIICMDTPSENNTIALLESESDGRYYAVDYFDYQNNKGHILKIYTSRKEAFHAFLAFAQSLDKSHL